MFSASSAKRCVLLNGPIPLRERPPPPFIDTRRDGVHAHGIVEVVVFPSNREGAVVEHCGKYTVGYTPGVTVVLGIVLGLAEIAPTSWRPQRAAF